MISLDIKIIHWVNHKALEISRDITVNLCGLFLICFYVPWPTSNHYCGFKYLILPRKKKNFFNYFVFLFDTNIELFINY